MARRKMTDEHLKTMRELHSEGLTVPAISQEMGMSQPTVYKYLMMMELQPNGRTRKEVDHVGLIEDYKDLTMTVSAVLAKYSISTTMLYSILRKNEVPPRQQNPEFKQAKLDQLEHALDMYQNSDKTIMTICFETGISQPVLHKTVREREIPFRNPKMAAPLYNEEGDQINKTWAD